MATPIFVEGCAARPDLKRQAYLLGSRVVTMPCGARSICFDRHVLCQPVEYVGPMPADRLSTVGALLRESSEDCEAE